jgi:hypothetical protein
MLVNRNDRAAQMLEAEAEEDRLEREGPDLHPPQELGDDGVPMYTYWDREAGTRPWPNLRAGLPPGWHQVPPGPAPPVPSRP